MFPSVGTGRTKEKFKSQNWSKSTSLNQRPGERIYHLPFDQQYDNIKIDPPNEFVALTVEEAEHSGFRRAFRWHSS